MKTILIMAAMVMASTSFAGLDQDKVDRLTRIAKQQFKVFSASGPDLAAMEANYTVEGGLQEFPGYGLISFRNVCISGSNVETTKPYSRCVQWSVDFEDKDGDEWTQTYDNFHKANMAEDDRFADSDAYCSAKSTPAILSHPINYKTKGCISWAVDFEDKDGDEWTQTFSNIHAAKRAENDRFADSEAYCAKRGIVKKTVATSQNLTVYRKRQGATEKVKMQENDADLELGKWKYTVPACANN